MEEEIQQQEPSEINQEPENIENDSSEKISIRKVLLFSVIVGIVFTLLVQLVGFFFTYRLVEAYSWLYGDIGRSCGDWCDRLTAVGFVIAAIHFIIFTFITALLVNLVLRKLKWGILKKIIIFILAFVVSGFSLTGLAMIGRKLPQMPVTIRCASFLINKDLKTGRFPFGVEGPRTNCIFDIAKKENSADICLRIGDEIYSSYCVGQIADINDDISLCDIYDSELSRARCIDETIESPQPILNNEKNNGSTGSAKLESPESLAAFARGDIQRSGYFPTGDINAKPSIYWNLDRGFHKIDPIVSGDAVVFGGYGLTDSGANIGVYSTESGKLQWNLKEIFGDGYFGSLSITPTLHEGNLYYNNYDNLFAYDLAGNKKLWETPINHIGSTVVAEGDVIYVLGNTSGGTGHTVTLFALDKNNGKEMWSNTYGRSVYHNESVVVTPTSIVLSGRVTHGTDPKVYIFDKSNGELKNEIQESVSVKDGGSVSSPVYGDNKIFVRSVESIYVIDDATGEIVNKIPVTFNKGDKSMTMAYNNNQLVLGAGDKVIAINTETYKIEWEAPFDGLVTTAPILTESYVYVATKSKLYALNRTDGDEKWAFDLISPIGSSIYASNGYIYFISTGQRLNILK